ncbi:hypothetical protein SAMN05192549_107292 [Duganella sacchari]|uniref:Uncharacterized protein n=1 Tax=Duganella sacchari TaxID=551987 RepID=A0A1M7QM85_9BURK|nr:hypothetical protein SAMN05192549_107292 [Duganella sacchari]
MSFGSANLVVCIPGEPGALRYHMKFAPTDVFQ